MERGIANVPKPKQHRSDDLTVRRRGQAGEIAEFYNLGIRVLEGVAKDAPNVAAAARAVAEKEVGVGFDRAEKAASFARLYRRSPPFWLFKLKTPAGKPLSVNHVRRIQSVRNLKQRKELLERAAERGWSAERLAHEIVPSGKIAGHRAPLAERAGPKAKRPADLTDALVKVSRWAEEWLMRYDRVWAQEDAWPPAIGHGEKNSADLAEMVGEVIGRLERIRESTDALAGRLKTLKRRLRNQETRNGGGKVPSE